MDTKRLKTVLLSLCLAIAALQLGAQQTYHRCSTMEYLAAQKQADPGLLTRMQQIEQFTQQYAQANPNGNSRAVVTIPVVVHVVYNTAAQNISDALIQAQINQLNLDYAHLNADAPNTPAPFAAVAANTNVQFCLAQRDPNGNASTGIVRKSTSSTSFTTNDKVKKSSTGGDDAWPSSSYLNLWVCNLGGGLLGYAQFPGGSSATDGVVVLYSSVGSAAVPGSATPYNFGRTATHEVGHWLNLYHIWGDDGTACTGTDNVGDTPNQSSENYGCPAYPHTDACTASSPGVMFMNYMDYTDDGCMNMFTQGQATRMNALFASGGARVSILNSQGCVPPATACALATGLSTSAITSSTATFNWGAVSGASSYSVQYRAVGSGTWLTGTSATTSYNASGLTAGTNYEWQVKTICSSGSSAFTASSTFTTTGTAPCNAPGSLTTSAITTATATFSWAAASGATSYNIQYRIVGAATWLAGTSSTASYNATGLTASSNYEWQVQTVCASGASAFTASATFTTAAPSTCSDVYEPNESRTAGKLITTNTDITGLISSTTDNDYFKFTTTSPNTNIQITLSNLPADYDLRLYNSSGTQLAISQNGSTTSETIKRNTNSAGTYYVRVYGYNGAISTSCYNLRVNVASTAFRLEGETTTPTSKEDANNIAQQVKLYPNPATDNITVEFISNVEGKARMNVYNLAGQKVLSEETTVTEGFNTHNVNTNALNSGIYIFEIENNGVTTHQKFTIAK